ncbi:MAG: hypothetical protein C4K47_04260 [Candidatus Thorarchaeota archaeon]|nr:MAG: hypothetical protein C4K47_04260 [Candidatus Thorarchaeota archaeon]
MIDDGAQMYALRGLTQFGPAFESSPSPLAQQARRSQLLNAGLLLFFRPEAAKVSLYGLNHVFW